MALRTSNIMLTYSSTGGKWNFSWTAGQQWNHKSPVFCVDRQAYERSTHASFLASNVWSHLTSNRLNAHSRSHSSAHQSLTSNRLNAHSRSHSSAHQSCHMSVEFYVTESGEPILGIDACRLLDIGLLRIVEENICEVIKNLQRCRCRHPEE